MFCCLFSLPSVISAYGSEAGSCGVKFIPTGGLFVSGGLTPKNIQFIEGENTTFMQAYWDKGRVEPVLHNVPLYAVMVEDLGVRGALKSAQIEYQKYSGNAPAKAKGMSGIVLWSHVGAAAAIGFFLGMAMNKKK